MKRILLGVCIAAFLCSPAAAAPVIDQKFDPPYGIGAWPTFAGGVEHAESSQTFTVGVTGMMTGVDVYVFSPKLSINPAPLVIDIRTTVGGVPVVGEGPHILASAEIDKSLIPNLSELPSLPESYDAWGQAPWVHVDFVGVPVTAGEQLAITLRSDDDEWYWWLYAGPISIHDPPSPQYAGGTLWVGGAGEPWFDGEVDAAFRTYVVPEPAALAMLAPLAAMALRRRRVHR